MREKLNDVIKVVNQITDNTTSTMYVTIIDGIMYKSNEDEKNLFEARNDVIKYMGSLRFNNDYYSSLCKRVEELELKVFGEKK